jgi:hypothetical protein
LIKLEGLVRGRAEKMNEIQKGFGGKCQVHVSKLTCHSVCGSQAPSYQKEAQRQDPIFFGETKGQHGSVCSKEGDSWELRAQDRDGYNW